MKKVFEFPITIPREKAEKERFLFIINYCKERALDPMIRKNFERAAFQWAINNCF